MNESAKIANIGQLTFQRNAFFTLSLLLSLALIITSIFQFLRSDKIVVIPYGINKEIWLENGKVSEHFLEMQGEIVANLLLNKTPSNTTHKSLILLKQTDPYFYGSLKKRLIQEEKALKEQGISYLFLTQEVRSDTDNMSTSVIGHRLSYLGDKQISNKREKYTFKFRSDGQKLLLVSIERGLK